MYNLRYVCQKMIEFNHKVQELAVYQSQLY